MQKTSRKAWYRRFGRKISPKVWLEDIFIQIEDKFPKFAHSLRYYSQIDVLAEGDFIEIIKRPHRLFDDEYFSSLRALCELIPNFDFERLQAMKIPLFLALVEDVVIHGHIKVPLRRSNGRAFDFEVRNGRHQGRISWGDTYPLPIYKTRHIDGDVIFVPRLKNVFHLLMENIVPSVCAITRRPDLIGKEVTFVTQVDYPLLTLFANYLNSRGFNASVIVISPFDKITVDRLIVARAFAEDSDLNYANAQEMEIIKKFIDEEIQKISVPEIVYVARTQTPRRNVLNQVELIKRLSQIGVPTYEFKFENFLEQIAVFRKAKLIITPHGAALSNIIWSPAGQNILELFSLNRRHKLFLQMAAQHELNYNLLFGSETSGNDNFQAPIEEIIGFIDRYRTAKK